MEFEFDLRKSASNLTKHGIDFFEAQELWTTLHFTIPTQQKQTESRYLVLGKIKAIHYTAIVTYRTKRIRIISVRRSRYEEKESYEERKKLYHH